MLSLRNVFVRLAIYLTAERFGSYTIHGGTRACSTELVNFNLQF